MNPLRELHREGQSVWLDFITRRYMAEGRLQALVSQDGVSGVTSNPTIFEKAIATDQDYASDIQSLFASGQSSEEIFEALAVRDIQQACDIFEPTYRDSQGVDGYVSLEVNPHLARDAQGTLREARRLYRRVNRPNLMIKIPATVEGLPAVEQALAEGIPVNVTLIFSVERYEAVLEAWLKGLERRLAAGQGGGPVASVASFFVSRLDHVIDAQLDQKAASAAGARKTALLDLRGKAAIANAKRAYQIFQNTVQSARWKALAAKGARVQRPLWASTSTKNPTYRDVLYVEELIGPDTVNTLPLPTLDAFRDHGRVRSSLLENPASAAEILAHLREAGIDLGAVTQRLEEDGLRQFVTSYDQLLRGIAARGGALNVKV